MSMHGKTAIAAKLPHPLILASASPRRAQLLREAGYTFTVQVSPAKEPALRPRDVPIAIWPATLAYIKAAAVQRHLQSLPAPRNSSNKLAPIILGADTIVTLHNRVLNKPRNRAHARHMLIRLFDQTHQVITGIALLCGDHIRLATATSVCYATPPTAAWLENYLDSHLWRGKAGAYGIQDDAHSSDPFITLLAGEFTNVMGLPMSLLEHELQTFLR